MSSSIQGLSVAGLFWGWLHSKAVSLVVKGWLLVVNGAMYFCCCCSWPEKESSQGRGMGLKEITDVLYIMQGCTGKTWENTWNIAGTGE